MSKPTYEELVSQLHEAEIRAIRAERLLAYAYRFRGPATPVNAWPKVKAFLDEMKKVPTPSVLRCIANVPETSYSQEHRCEKTAAANSLYCGHHEK